MADEDVSSFQRDFADLCKKHKVETALCIAAKESVDGLVLIHTAVGEMLAVDGLLMFALASRIGQIQGWPLAVHKTEVER